MSVQNNAVDFGFFELWGLKPAAGRFFSQDHADAISSDPAAPMQGSVVINETASRAFGFKNAQDAVGTAITVPGFRDSAKASEIIGVVPDFALDSVHEAVVPSVYYVSIPEFNYLSAKLTGRDIPDTLDAIQRLWAKGPDNWLLKFTFQNTVLDRNFTDITRQGQMLTVFASVALFVACLGLIGLSVVTAERRTKEIGVRKALGATKRDIFGLLLREFARPVLWANVIAWPVGYIAMRHWLLRFAYHVGLEPWIFVAAGALAVFIALATVASHAFMVARAQPATALRYE